MRAISGASPSRVLDAIDGGSPRDVADIWRSRRLKAGYAIVAFDRLPIRLRDAFGVHEGALLFALGVSTAGEKDILGVWRAESVQPWAAPLADMRRRGLGHWHLALADLAAQDGSVATLEGRVLQVLPRLLRRTLISIPPKRRRTVQAGLNDLLDAESEDEARSQLDRIAASAVGADYPGLVADWTRCWPDIAPHFERPVGVRRFLERFDPLESLKAKLARRTARLAAVFDSDVDALAHAEAALVHVAHGWKAAPRPWAAPRRYFEALDHASRPSQRPPGTSLWRARHA